MVTVKRTNELGVSPVVGIMLMLVVTIIIAAVVSAFSGGLSSNQQKAPSLSAHIEIVNGGGAVSTGPSSEFTIYVDSVSEPIPTKDVKIVTSWSAQENGSTTNGGATLLPGVANWKAAYQKTTGTQIYRGMPYGYGPGVEKWGMAQGESNTPEQMFGNYTLMSQTTMYTNPYGRTSTTGGYGAVTAFNYTTGAQYIDGTHHDGMQQILGDNWGLLRQGNVVNVKIVHIPSGKTMLDKNVPVKG